MTVRPSPVRAGVAPAPAAPAPAAAPCTPPHSLTRRAWLAGATRAAVAGALAGAAGALRPAAAAAGVGAQAPTQPLALTVYKDPNCGCCEQWVTHMAAAGFRPAVHDVSDLAAVKARLGVPAALHSCHTAVVGGVVVEGHVPAADVRRFLRERPRVGRAAARGLAVPGMPAGSPGMEGPPPERYAVLAFAAGGATTRFASH